MTKKTGLKGGFKTRATVLEREIKLLSTKRVKLGQLEERSRNKWTKEYAAYRASVKQYIRLKNVETKKASALSAKIEGWDSRSMELTKIRDSHRKEMREVENQLTSLTTQLVMLREEEINQTRATDEIITQVFALNEVVVRSANDLGEYLKRQIFHRLIDAEGNLSTQITFDSSTGLRRVIAMVNSMTLIKKDLADEAQRLINQFFARFQKEAEIDQRVKPLYELTRQLLIEKTSFKVGPDLYRFLSMELDIEEFPELVQAQLLFRQSIRSEKTNSYIQIWERASRNDKWVRVPQS